MEGQAVVESLERIPVTVDLDVEAGEAGMTSIRTSVLAGTTSGGALPPCIASGVHTKAGMPDASTGPPAAIE